MPNTIDTNSFFDQSGGDGSISAILPLVKQLQLQFKDLSSGFNSFVADINQGNEEVSDAIKTNVGKIDTIEESLSKIQDDVLELSESFKDLDHKVDSVSDVFFRFEQSQKAAAEKADDDAFRAQDAAQKGIGKKGTAASGIAGGLLGLSSASALSDKESRDPQGGGLGGALFNLAALGQGMATGVGKAFQGIGSGIKDIGGKAIGGIKGLFGKGKKGSSGILGPISSDPNDMVNMPEGSVESTVTKRKVKPHHFDMKTGKAYIDGEEVSLEEYREFKSMSSEEQLSDPRFSTGDPISPTEGTDEKGLEPKGEEGEKKEKGLFGGFFSGLLGGDGKEKVEDTTTGTGKDEKGKDKKDKKDKGKMTPYDFLQEKGLKVEDMEDGMERIVRVYNPFIINEETGESEQGITVSGTYKGKDQVSTKQFINGSPHFQIKSLRRIAKDNRGGGLKGKLGGAADAMTGGMFDFDNKNRKGAPKDFGIRRMAGGIADSMTGGLTDFDKRGKGNMQFNPIGGGKDKAWGAADEQAKRGEKQSGMGIKRGIGGALDFATLGTFDFDKQNKKGAPKGWGIKRVAGGLADAITGGTTDFDKRGAGIGQYSGFTGGGSKKRKSGGKIEASDGTKFNTEFMKNKYEEKLAKDNMFNNLSAQANAAFNPVDSGAVENVQQLTSPPDQDTTEVLPPIDQGGDNISEESNQVQGSNAPDKSNDETPADGTECDIDCINMMKSNSMSNISF